MRRNLPITDFAFPKRVVLQEAYAAGRTIYTYEPDRPDKKKDVLELQGLFTQLAEVVKERIAATMAEDRLNALRQRVITQASHEARTTKETMIDHAIRSI